MEFLGLLFSFSFFVLIRAGISRDSAIGGESSPGDLESLKRQTPRCYLTTRLSVGDSSPLVSQNYPRNYPPFTYCSWSFTCPVNAYLRCPNFQIPSSDGCNRAAFVYNGKRICGSAGKSLNDTINVGSDLQVEFYTFQTSGTGFRCSVTCGDGSAVALAAPTTPPPAVACRCGVSTGAKREWSARTNGNATDEDEQVDRIVGGTEVTDQRKYPWMAQITDNYMLCGGALINDRYVLTAAHCIIRNPNATYFVTLGDLDLSRDDESQSIQIPSRGIIHPNYNPVSGDNDVALLKLEDPVNFKEHPNIIPICLSASAVPEAGDTAQIAGWGTTAQGGGAVLTMREATVSVVDEAACFDDYLPVSAQIKRNITKNMFCASAPGKDACQGDSGGPIMQKTPSGYYVDIGIVSWGMGCAQVNYPGVYVKTANYVNGFLKDETRDAKWCATP